MRHAVADVQIAPANLICPLFVGNLQAPADVASMPNVQQLPVEAALAKIDQLTQRGLFQFIVFGVTGQDLKNPQGSYAKDPQAPVNRLLAAARKQTPQAVLYADLCLCEYTSHGHCGIVLDQAADDAPSLVVDNDATLEQLSATAIAQAEAGAHVVAPSGMMDGQVAAIRKALDAAGHVHTAILSYSVKYASHMYGPFRDAGQGAMQFGDRCGYQMDYRRSREWRVELEADVAQGADMVMVKPALTCLDIIHQVRNHCALPVVAYHVSGEYAMIHAAAQRGWLDLKDAAVETTTAIRRAGADLVITYFAPELLDWI